MSTLDPAVLGEHRQLGDDVVTQLVALVSESLIRNVARIRSAQGKDPAAISDAAHSIKNSSNNVGATRLRQLASTLEQESDKTTAEALIDDVCSEAQRVLDALQAQP